MAQRGERLVVLHEVAMYTPISGDMKRSWVRIPYPPTLYAYVKMNLVMCSGNAPYKVVATGSLRYDWFSLVSPAFPIGGFTGFFISYRYLLASSDGGVRRED